jgi:hypothetical protein
MVTIFCGSRHLTHPNPTQLILKVIIESHIPVTFIRAGGAKGPDTWAIQYAIHQKIPYEIVRADWLRDGRAAGRIRNRKMADMEPKAMACIAIWDGIEMTSGTLDMFTIMRDLGRKVYLHQL